MTNPRDRWLEARGGLTGLLETLRPTLDENTLKLVQEFVANREFGIALEWLYSVVLERKIGLSAQQSKDFKELAKLMEMDLPGQRATGGPKNYDDSLLNPQLNADT